LLQTLTIPIFSEIEEGRAEASIVKNETSGIENYFFQKLPLNFGVFGV
jgi:hypothetical protein